MNDAHNPQVTTDSASSAFTLPAFLHTLRGTAWLWLLVIPPVLVLLWHLRNRGWPSDDSANMMATAYQQYLVFSQSGVLHGLQGLYAIRGWRPIALPPLAVPFLLLFHGNVLAAGSAVLSLAYAGWVAYVFAIARRYLPRLQAAAATAATVSFPAFVVYDLIFNTEGAWLFAAFGWLYHSLAAEDFRRPRHAALAGLLLGVAVMLRPAETSLMVAVPFCYLAAKARHSTPWHHIMLGFALLGILAAALIASAFVAGLDRDKLLVIGETAIILWLLALRGKLGGFSIFCGTMGVCVLGWWAGFMPALYGWVYTTSFGPMAHATALFQGASLWTKLYETFSVYFGWQSLVIAGLGCAMILWHWQGRPINSGPDDGSASPIELGALAAFMLAPLLIVYAMTGTTDSRRAIVGVAAALLTVAIAALRTGAAQRVRTTIVLVAAAINGFALVIATLPGLAVPSAMTDAFKLYLPAAHLTPDADPALISALDAAGVPPTSNVAVYTLALFYAQARVYEPAELELAAQVDGQGSYQIGYLWDEGDYAGVLHRLYAMNYRYLVLDLYPGPGWPVAQNPYVEFTTHLLGIYKNGAGISPGLKRMQTLQLGGRAHELFEIEPQ